MDAFRFLLDFFFSKLSGKHFIDLTLQMYRLISPRCLCILSWFSNSGDTQISMYIHVPFGHAVFIKKHFETSSVISDQASMYMFSLVSVFCSRLLLWNSCHLKFTLFCVNILITVLFRVLKIKINLVKLTFLSSSYGNESHKTYWKCWLWKIYHAEYGPFLVTDWLKTKWSGRVMDKHGITFLYHLHQCRPCTSSDIPC